MIKPANSISFLLSINIFVWQNVLYFLDAPRTFLFVISVLSSSFVLSRHVPSLSFVGRSILLNTFLSVSPTARKNITRNILALCTEERPNICESWNSN